MRIGKKTGFIVAAVAIVLAAVVIFSVFARLDKLETTKTVGSFNTYEVGKLDQETGKGLTKSAIEDCDDYDGFMHLKSYINADGLKCKLVEKATIEYKVYFFDDHYNAVVNSDWLTDDFNVADYSSYTDIKYAMIEITPTADPDGIISNSEISGYAKQLTVTYNK